MFQSAGRTRRIQGKLLSHGSRSCHQYGKREPTEYTTDLFTDYRKAYYSVETPAVMEALKEAEEEETFIAFFEDIYKQWHGHDKGS